jgi:hypothetical protein
VVYYEEDDGDGVAPGVDVDEEKLDNAKVDEDDYDGDD